MFRPANRLDWLEGAGPRGKRSWQMEDARYPLYGHTKITKQLKVQKSCVTSVAPLDTMAKKA